MSRFEVILKSEADRAKAVRAVAQAPTNTSVTFKVNKRSTPQNSRMWAMLSDVAHQAEHNGRKYTADQWKVLFLHALGREFGFIPALDGSTFIPWGQSSSDLTKQEMSDLMELMAAWGAERGIKFQDDAAVSA